MIHNLIIRIHNKGITAVIYLNLVNLILNLTEINVHSDNTYGLPVYVNRHNIRNHINIDIGIQIRIHPRRCSVVDWNIIPAHMLQIRRIINRKIRGCQHLERLLLRVLRGKNPRSRLCEFRIITDIIGQGTLCLICKFHRNGCKGIRHLRHIGCICFKSGKIFNRTCCYLCKRIHRLLNLLHHQIQILHTAFALCPHNLLRIPIGNFHRLRDTDSPTDHN